MNGIVDKEASTYSASVSIDQLDASHKHLSTKYQTLKTPFPKLHGEVFNYIGRINKSASLALSNYRLIMHQSGNLYCIPLGLIDIIELVQTDGILILCKDVSVMRCTFTTEFSRQTWITRISTAIRDQSHGEGHFAYYHMSGSNTQSNDGRGNCIQSMMLDNYTDVFQAEYHRMKFSNEQWRITDMNGKFRFSSTYPKLHIVPKSISDEMLEEVFGFRSLGRIPSVVWRDQATGAVIARSGQPHVAFFGYRCADDEALIKAISECSTGDTNGEDAITHGMVASAHVGCLEDKSVCNNGLYPFNMSASLNPLGTNGYLFNSEAGGGNSSKGTFLIIDARSYTAALVNRAVGGGVEYPDYYSKCVIEHMSLPNIHNLRKSFQALRALCSQSSDQLSWLTNLEATKWLQFLGALLRTALVVCESVKSSRSVLVHCTHGWDRTPQIVSLAEIMLDPYYRTVDGFIIVIEREWLAFGHKFADRCGHSLPHAEQTEQSPVFLQWLDCVYQIMKQFPCSFEFNEVLLVKLAHHSYSRLYGTFLFNNVQERLLHKVASKTKCFLHYVKTHREKFLNFMYDGTDKQVLTPSYHLRNLSLWTTVYFPTPLCTDSQASKTPRNQPLVNGDDKCPLLVSRSQENSNYNTHQFEFSNGIHSLIDENDFDIIACESNYCLSRSDPNVIVDELNDSIAKIDFVQSGHEIDNDCDDRSNNEVNPLLKEKSEIAEQSQIIPPLSPGSLKEYCKQVLVDAFDVDGLIKYPNPTQSRLQEIMAYYHSEISYLRSKLEAVKLSPEISKESTLREHSEKNLTTVSPSQNCKCLTVSVSEELQSWEEVTDEDTKMTLWVPDYAASNCHECGAQFWLITRRHHCRSCGYIFCGNCANHYAPVPEEQLFDPVRVCNHCYIKLSENKK